jgi:hypothetical protein
MRMKVQEAYLQWSPTKRVRESRKKKRVRRQIVKEKEKEG